MTRCPLLLLLLLIPAFFFSFAAQTSFAQSGGLEDTIDIVSDDGLGAHTMHSVSFTLPHNAQQITSTDYINLDLEFFTNLTAPTLTAGSYTGTPVYSVSDTTAKVTGINVLPGKRITIEGVTANNPQNLSQFLIRITVTLDAAGDQIKNAATASVTKHSGNVDVSATIDVPQSRLQISGYTAPGTYVIFTEGEAIRGTDVATGVGFFSKIFPSYPVGDHNLGIYGIDLDNRSTSIHSVSIYAPVYQTVSISNLLLSPTMEISSNQILQGDPLTATGSAYPGTTVTIFTDTPTRTYTASASATGAWTYSIANTSDYSPGDYRIYSLAQTSGGLQSITSSSQLFTITTTSGGGGTSCGDITNGDLNCDDIL